MALLGIFERDDYMPEYGTLMLRDTPSDSGWQPDDPLVEYATDAQPCGTVARAGYGWLEGASGDGYHLVRLELHSDAPPVDLVGWDAVMETPFATATGGVGLTYVTSTPMTADLEIGSGLFRVRVSRGRHEDDERWLLQFWPSEPTPPQWLLRDQPPVSSGSTGWSDLFGYEASELLGAVYAAANGGTTTISQIETWATAHHRPADWLDQPLFPAPPEPLPSGHADLDSAARKRHSDALAMYARKLSELAGFAAQLGVSAPTTRRGMLALLTASGQLTVSSDEYRVVHAPPNAWEVLSLPASRVESFVKYDASRRYARFASDIVSLVAWSSGTMSLQELASRLLAPPADVQATLSHAVTVGLLAVDGDTLTVLPKRPTPSGYVQPTPTAPSHTPPKPPRPPLGAPPRAGMVTSTGDVVVWRAGAPVTLGRWPGSSLPNAALESPHGIVLLGYAGESVLVRPDGSVMSFGTDLMASGRLSEDGRYLAVGEARFHKRDSWHALHLIDLTNGSRQTMPWDDQHQIGGIVAFYDGAVYFTSDGSTITWTPGTNPKPAGLGLRTIDQLSGISLRVEDNQGVIIGHPDGTRRRIAIDPGVMLAPGGTALYSLRYSPPAVTLFPLGSIGTPEVHWLPTDTGGDPTWEDPNTLVIKAPAEAVRLNIQTGDFERVPLQGRGGVLITPSTVDPTMSTVD